MYIVILWIGWKIEWKFSIIKKLIIEKGCWYLSDDTADLFVGIEDEQGALTLKRINGTYATQVELLELITKEVDKTITEDINTKIEDAIQEKVDSGEINVTTDSISYGEF